MHCNGRLTRQAALERQDLSCTYLAHHELESILLITIIMDGRLQSCCWTTAFFAIALKHPGNVVRPLTGKHSSQDLLKISKASTASCGVVSHHPAASVVSTAQCLVLALLLLKDQYRPGLALLTG